MTSFGELLRGHRHAVGISQEELAYRASLSPQAVSLLERGVRRFPRPETIEALVKALGIAEHESLRLADAARRTSASKHSQLPPAPIAFTGRDDVLRVVVAYLSAGGVPHPIVPVLAIDGMAGAGKTALAVKAAHEVIDDYPDGQLFVDLHGFTEGVRPEDPSAALAQILRSFGIPDQQIPDDLAQRSALYRTTLAGKRILVVLDNAVSADQLAPLLPGAAGCAVLVTSRSRLVGLGSARPVSIGPLTESEAAALFTEVAGRSDDPELLPRIAELCGHLPLALEIVAAQYRDSAGTTLAGVIEQLSRHGDAVAELRTDAAFQISYAPLSPDHQRVFRLMSLNPGPTLDETAAATVAGLPLQATRSILDRLVDQHLLTEDQPGIYGFHDLLRSFAFRTSTSEGASADRHQAVQALHRHYVGMAARAMDLVHSYEQNRRPQPTAPAEFGWTLPDRAAAESWLDREMETLLRIADTDADQSVILSGTLHRHLQTRGRVTDAEKLGTVGLSMARARGEQLEEARILNNFALVRQIQGRGEEAAQLYERALEIAEAARWDVGQLVASLGQGEVERIAGHHTVAATHYGTALEISQAIHDSSGELRAFIGLGDTERHIGRLEEAKSYYEQAIAVSRRIGDASGEINAGVGLGDICLDLGLLTQAVERYEDAESFAESIQHAPARDYARRSLSNAYREAGQYTRSAELLAESLAYNRQTGDGIAELGALINLAETLLDSGSTDASRGHYEAGRAMAHEVGDDGMESEAYRGLGRILHLEQHDEQALAQYQHALELVRGTGKKLPEARLHQDIAESELALGRVPEATKTLYLARDLLTGIACPELTAIEAQLAAIGPFDPDDRQDRQ